MAKAKSRIISNEFEQQISSETMVALPLTVAVEELELSDAEASERHRLELKVERAFYEAGAALRELRDRRLYRSTHKTFEEYCCGRFGYTRRRPYQLIEAAIVFENLCTNGTQIDSFEMVKEILPTSERQVRDLINLEPAEQKKVWQQAIEEAGNKVPSSRIVKGLVEQLKQKPLIQAADYCTCGDVFTLTGLVESERKYNGCWALASGTNAFTITVDVHDTTLTVKPENLKPIDEPDARRQLPPSP